MYKHNSKHFSLENKISLKVNGKIYYKRFRILTEYHNKIVPDSVNLEIEEMLRTKKKNTLARRINLKISTESSIMLIENLYKALRAASFVHTF